MKNTGKKTLSLLLTAVLLLGLLSVSALAGFDPIAGLASLGEFTQPETVGPEATVSDPLTVNQEAGITVNPGTEPNGEAGPTEPEELEPDDGKLRIYTTDRGLHLTIDGPTGTEPAVPAERETAVYGKEDPARNTYNGPGMGPGTALQLRTPEAEELYLDRLALEKELGYYSTDWTVLNLTDGEGFRRNLTGSYDVTVSGPAMEKYQKEGTVFALLKLHWNEEGKIEDRDVSILSPTHTPSFSSWSFRTDSLSTLLIVVPTAQAIQEEEELPAGPQRVVFRCEPEEALVVLFPAPTETNPEPNAVPPQADGSWSLEPGNYSYSVMAEGYVPVLDRALTVAPQEEGADLVVELTLEKKPAAIRADRQWKVYGEADPELTYTVEGLPEDVVITGALSRTEGENVGTYAITQGTLRVEGDYEVQFIGADFAITKADAVILKAPEPVTGP